MKTLKTALETLAVLIGVLLVSAGFYIFVVNIRPLVGVSVWENELNTTTLYALLSAFGILIGWSRSGSIVTFTSYLVPLAIAAAALAHQFPIGSLAATLVVALSALASATVRFKAYQLNTTDSPDRLPLGASILIATVLTGLIGSVWVWTTAPTYAEGFVVLAWLLLAAFHLAIGLMLSFTTWLFHRAERCGYALRVGNSISVIVLSLLLSLSSMYHMIWIEGEPETVLGAAEEWKEAFRQMPGSDTTEEPQRETPTVTKQDVIALVLKQKPKSTSHLATLYFLTGNEKWAIQFKQKLLSEADQRLFTSATGSVKYIQRKAMFRAMYFIELEKKLPNLFTEQEKDHISAWFAEIAKRIFQPEWVDWLYAVPFKIIPEGPYLNQEVGAGALAALQTVVTRTDPALGEQIADYLERKAVGFRRNYRNQDDALGYQGVWLENAFVLARYADRMAQDKTQGLRPALDWLMLQLPSDDLNFNYGLPSAYAPLGPLAIGAFVLGDEHAKWLLDRYVSEKLQSHGRLGEELVALWLWDDSVPSSRFSPRSVHLLGPTGYAFRPGIMAEDKLVIRSQDNTQERSRQLFALAGLRNIGWHRYPATNTLIRFNSGENVLLAENIPAKKHRWLPAGRATHRDKKIDRSQLNGVVIERTGLDAWMGNITGVYSRWRQDAPRASTVENWDSVGNIQYAKVRLMDWDGVTHERNYILEGDYRFTVVDRLKDVSGKGREKGILWHTSGFSMLSSGMLERDMGNNESVTMTVLSDRPSAPIVTSPSGYFEIPAYRDAAITQHTKILTREDEMVSVVSFQIGKRLPAKVRLDAEQDNLTVTFAESDKETAVTLDARGNLSVK